MHFTTSYLLLLLADLGSTVYIHVEDGVCINLHDPSNTGIDPDPVIVICGEDPKGACGTGDGSVYALNNPYDCKGCDTITIYDGFPFDKSTAQATPQCQATFTFPVGYGDVYYNDSRLYDAFGDQIGDTSCNSPVIWGGNFVNPWNSYPDNTQPTVTPCSGPALTPTPTVTCYYNANPDACPDQYEVGWCYCNDYAPMYPVLPNTAVGYPCGYTVMPTTTTTSPLCTATGP